MPVKWVGVVAEDIGEAGLAIEQAKEGELWVSLNKFDQRFNVDRVTSRYIKRFKSFQHVRLAGSAQ